jgi:hypothetical protein
VIDLPEPENVSAEFVYNYFVRDERRNASGGDFDLSAADLLEKYQLRSMPRYVRLSWSQFPFDVSGLTNGSPDVFTLDNVGMVQSEQVFSNFSFVAVNFQDNGLDNKLFNMVSGSTDVRGIDNGSVTDAAKKLNSVTRREVSGGYLIEGINRPSRRGMQQRTRRSKVTGRFDILRDIGVRMQINNKRVKTIVGNVAADVASIFADEMASLLPKATAIQDNAASKLDDSVTSSDWDTGFVPVMTRKQSSSDDSRSVSGISGVGYIVERDEIGINGAVIDTRQFVVKGTNTRCIVDPDVKYGASYRYRVKCVASVSLPGTDVDRSASVFTGLVSSQPSISSVINCIELTPPPPPADFKPTWDYDSEHVRLIWSFPVNSQRDVKRFQVFRRKNLKEPFTLLAEYNFDDSLDPTDSGETIDAELIKYGDPKTYYIDTETNKETRFIYTTCCIDAHGLSSNFSQQFEVSFDRFNNSIVSKEIARSGAPKAYPNMTVDKQVFVDTMKTSGHRSFKVYFNPDCLNVKTRDGIDLDLLPFGQDSFFRFHMINVDMQKMQSFDVSLDDKRTGVITRDAGSTVVNSTTTIV